MLELIRLLTLFHCACVLVKSLEWGSQSVREGHPEPTQ
jgi:hypothetical protein